MLSLFHKENPYHNFDYKKYPLDLQGWGSTEANFLKLIDRVKPKLIVEVGSWKGGSAIHMAEYIKQNDIDCKIICIDTWLGAVEFLISKSDKDRYLSLNKINGYPSVYYQFLANIMHKGLEDIVIPFPQTSVLAARFLGLNKISADLIYIDASHDEKDVFDDLNNYWNILNSGGVIFGDDYDIHWPGVKIAVNNFVVENEIQCEFTERQWSINKGNEKIKGEEINIYQKARDNKFLALGYERDLFLANTENVRLASCVERLQRENSELQDLNIDLKEANKGFLRSWSWRLTLPLRYVASLVRVKN